MVYKLRVKTKTLRLHRRLRVRITLHQQTKNQILHVKYHKKSPIYQIGLFLLFCCRRGIRTTHDVVSHSTIGMVVHPSRQEVGITLRLSYAHHPRDRRAWLPVSTPYNVDFSLILGVQN